MTSNSTLLIVELQAVSHYLSLSSGFFYFVIGIVGNILNAITLVKFRLVSFQVQYQIQSESFQESLFFPEETPVSWKKRVAGKPSGSWQVSEEVSNKIWNSFTWTSNHDPDEDTSRFLKITCSRERLRILIGHDAGFRKDSDFDSVSSQDFSEIFWKISHSVSGLHKIWPGHRILSSRSLLLLDTDICNYLDRILSQRDPVHLYLNRILAGFSKQNEQKCTYVRQKSSLGRIELSR